MTVVNVNGDNFEEEVVNADKPVLVDFFADWCGPCKMMAPAFEDLSDKYDNLKFAKLDTQQNQDIAQKYSIQGIPALLVLSKGKEVDRIVGFAPKEALKRKIDSILEKIE